MPNAARPCLSRLFPSSYPPMPHSTGREFDIIIWGATGFTGQLVCEYFSESILPNHDLKWALAGRTLEKVQAVKDALRQKFPAHVTEDSPAVLIGTADDQESVDRIVATTAVIISTGPQLSPPTTCHRMHSGMRRNAWVPTRVTLRRV